MSTIECYMRTIGWYGLLYDEEQLWASELGFETVSE